MTHPTAYERLPDLLADRDDPELVAHVAHCHECQQQLFRLTRVDRVLRSAATGRRRRHLRGRLAGSAAAVVAVAAALIAAALLHVSGSAPTTRAFAIHTADGRTLGHAVVRRQDQATDRVILVARGMPVVRGNQYLLWTEAADGKTRMPVGRFMVDKSGSCRVRFTLPASTRWRGFLVTQADNPTLVVAST